MPDRETLARLVDDLFSLRDRARAAGAESLWVALAVTADACAAGDLDALAGLAAGFALARDAAADPGRN